MPTRSVNVTEFKSHCLALLKEIEAGETITVTRRGCSVAVVSPVTKTMWKSPAGSWAGKIEIFADLDNLDMSELWELDSKG